MASSCPRVKFWDVSALLSCLRSLQDRGNGVKLLVRVLEALVEEVPSLRLVDLKGGDKHNAIPREAFATVLLPTGDWFMWPVHGMYCSRRHHRYQTCGTWHKKSVRPPFEEQVPLRIFPCLSARKEPGAVITSSPLSIYFFRICFATHPQECRPHPRHHLCCRIFCF